MSGRPHAFNRSVANAGWLLADYGVRLGVGLIVGAVVARYLGPQKSGVLNYAVAAVACAVPLINLDAAVIHALIAQPQRRADILSTGTAVKFCASLVCYILLFFAIRLLRPDDSTTQWVVAIVALGMVLQVGDMIDYDLQSRLEGFVIVRARMLAFLASSGIRLLLVAFSASVASLASVIPLEALLATILLVASNRKRLAGVLPLHFDRPLAAQLIRTTWPVALSGFLLAASTHADKIVLGQLRTSTEVGLYFAAYQLSGLWYFVAIAIGASAAPGLTGDYAAGRQEYRLRLQQLSCVLTAIAIAVGLLTTLFADLLVDVLFGPAFHATAALLKIHVWTSVFVFHVHLRTRALVIENKQHFIAGYAALTLAASLLLNLLLVGKHGAAGAAYASLLSWMMCAVLFPLMSSQTRDFTLLFARSFNPALWWQLLRG